MKLGESLNTNQKDTIETSPWEAVCQKKKWIADADYESYHAPDVELLYSRCFG